MEPLPHCTKSSIRPSPGTAYCVVWWRFNERVPLALGCMTLHGPSAWVLQRESMPHGGYSNPTTITEYDPAVVTRRPPMLPQQDTFTSKAGACSSFSTMSGATSTRSHPCEIAVSR